MRSAADWRVVVASGAAAGLAGAPFLPLGGGWFRPLLALTLIAVVVVERGRAGLLGLVAIGGAAILAGLLVGQARLNAIEGHAYGGTVGETVRLEGFAEAEPSTSRGTVRFPFSTERGRMMVETPADQAPEVVPGLGLVIRGEVGLPPEWMAGSLERQGLLRVVRADEIEPDGRRRTGLTGLIDRLRDRARAALGIAVPDREAALSRGFVLGEDDSIDERTEDDFRRAGVAHLLAVSGQNVVLLSLLAMPLLSLTGIGPRARLLAVAGLILLYVPLAGGGASIQRAGVMGIAGMVALAATRAPSRVYALALAGMFTLLLNPRATADIGWQLSFAAVVGIMLLARPLQVRLAGMMGGKGWRAALSDAIAVTLAATIATAPLTVFHFEQLPVASIPANLVVLPAVAPAMWMGMLAIAAGQVTPALAVPFNLAGSVCLAWIAQAAEWFGRPEWAVMELKVSGPVELIVVSALVGGLVALVIRLWQPGRTPRGGLIALLTVVVAALLILPVLLGGGRRELAQPPDRGARVEVLDIGQGDAILIRPWREDPLLIDGGPPGGGLTGALASAGVDRLAAVMLTHPDLDHYGGLTELFGTVPVGRFLYDRSPPELVALARSTGAKTMPAGAGQVVRDGDVRLEVLWPPEGGPSPATPDEAETNLRSIVALLEYRRFRMLLTGDAEAESVPMEPGPIDVLKVSHHGSEDAGLESLLEQTSPRLAVISVGKDNRYGHPVDQVLETLNQNGVETLRTDQDGTISIVLERNTWRVETGS